MWNPLKSWLPKPEVEEESPVICSVTFNVVPVDDSCEVEVDMTCVPGSEGYLAATIHSVANGNLYGSVDSALDSLIEKYFEKQNLNPNLHF